MPTYTGNSIVDYLKSTGSDSSYSSRKSLAEQNGITGYIGSADQNTRLLGLLSNKNTTPQVPAISQQPVGTGALPNVDDYNNTPQDGISASGRFDGMTDEEIAQQSRQLENVSDAAKYDNYGLPQARQANESAQDYALRIRNSTFSVAGENTPTGGIAPRTLSFGESAAYAQQSGLKGIADSAFAGLTDAQARRKSQELLTFYKGQTSQNSSSVFNPETINGVKKTISKFQLQLDGFRNDPFASQGTKKDKASSLFETTAQEIANSFGSREDFMSEYQRNPDLKKQLDAFIAQGGSMEQITAKIGGNEQQKITDSRQSVVQDLIKQGVSDPNTILDYVNFDEKGNKIGDFTLQEVQSYMNSGPMSTEDFLASVGKNGTEEAYRAEQALIPEKAAAQQEIASIAGIPESLKRYYFGSEQQLGILAEKVANAKERTRILEEKESDDKNSLREKAQYEIERSNIEMEGTLASIEENRLNAKNYMTAKLAKLGALQTTGNAPLAIATLDQKYEVQKAKTESAYKSQSRLLAIKLGDALNKVENDTDMSILKLREDISKDSEEVIKEVMKAENSAQLDIMKIKTSYAKTLRTEVDKYTNSAKKDAEKYTKDYISYASKGFNTQSIEAILSGNPQGASIPVKASKSAGSSSSSKLSKGTRDVGFDSDSTYKYFMTLPKEFRDLYVRQSTMNPGEKRGINDIRGAYTYFTQEKPRISIPKPVSTKTSTKKNSSVTTADDI